MTLKDSTYYSVPDFEDLDLTGSPLEWISEEGKFDDISLINPQKHWQKDEENHGALSPCETRSILFMCGRTVSNWKTPIYVLGDASDVDKTVLMSRFNDKKNGWVTRSVVRMLGHWSYKQAEAYVADIIKEHVDVSKMPKQKVKSCITNVYEIVGSIRNTEHPQDCSLSLNISWSDSTSIALPPLYADTTLETILILDQSVSPAYKLWLQLKLLHQLLILLTSAKQKQDHSVIQLPTSELVTESSRTDMLTLIHELDYTYKSYSESVNFTDENMAEMRQLNLLVEQTVSGKSTHYWDFTHHLFLLLINCRDSQDLVRCLMAVFQEVQSGNAKPFVHPKNPTNIARIITECIHSGFVLPELSGTKAVEYLIEIGLNKLSKDYANIFLHSELATLEQLNLSSADANIMDNPRGRLDTLARLHVTLEILLLVASKMQFCLTSLAAYILNNIHTQVKSVTQLLETGHLKFKAPVVTKDVQEVITRRYFSSRLELTSVGKIYKVSSVLYCSTLPVFPYIRHTSNIPTESQLLDEVSNVINEDVYCSHLTYIGSKLGNF
ncbi:protein zwilch homolog isoform X2 [Periplaneta americana]|uniref:protein zwilch homolog isoform X2 n=1 Tax=Periplaneta americana TaxID=6978 RepID=UPI0037E89E95